ncbi:response regulator [Pollutibacter soli]|uniref:response regulator n=1 Tax=Pollutibacter soli TaxID=3034157 RepID=UPI003013F121
MKTILVIEDNQDIRENIAEILELGGYRALVAENGKLGVEVALKENPDLIVCDIMMPGLDGYGVLHLLRKNESTQYTPFIFLTAKVERGDFRKGMEMGADDYITKPFEDIELLNAIEMRLKKSEVLKRPYSTDAAGFNSFLKDAQDNGFIKNLSEQYSAETYSKKQLVYAEGKRPRYVYLILQGKLKIYKTHEVGKEYITEILGAGEFAGMNAVISETQYEENAAVLEEAELLQIPADDFRKLVYSDIQVAGRFIQIISGRMKEKEDRLVNLAYSSLRKRVARALADLHQKNQSSGITHTVIDISREEIAQYVGTATESLIRTLSDFRNEKLVEIVDGKIRINDVEKLKKLSY